MILAIDCGLSAVKVALSDLAGNVIAIERAPYPTHNGKLTGEQDPADWWRALQAACSRLPREARRQVSVIVPTGHMHALIAVDAQLHPLLPCLTLHDRRGDEDLRRIDADVVHAITGQIADAALPLAKLLWLKRARPDVVGRVHAVLAPKDMLAGWLTGEPCTDPIDATGTGLFDHRRVEWSQTLIELSGLTPEQLPVVRPCTEVRGLLRERPAFELGLPAGAAVLVGAGDDIELLGATAHRTDVAVEHVGTTGAILRAVAHGATTSRSSLETYPTAEADVDALGASTTNCGSALGWARAVLGSDPIAALGSDPGDDDPIILPQLFAERTNHQIGGTIIGLDASHDATHLARAFAVGVADLLAQCIAEIETGSSTLTGLVTSGGSGNPQWLRLRAAAYQRPIEALASDPTALGCIALGLVAAGQAADPSTAARMLRITRTIVEPDPALVEVLTRIAARRRTVLERMTPVVG